DADSRPHAPRVVTAGPPVVDGHVVLADTQLALDAADLVEALVVLLDPTAVALEVGLLRGRCGYAGPGQVGGQPALRVLEPQPQLLERLDDLHRDRATGALEVRAQRGRGTQVELPAVTDDDHPGVEDVHVAIGTHGDLNAGPAVGGHDIEPIAIEE